MSGSTNYLSAALVPDASGARLIWYGVCRAVLLRATIFLQEPWVHETISLSIA